MKFNKKKVYMDKKSEKNKTIKKFIFFIKIKKKTLKNNTRSSIKYFGLLMYDEY